MTQACQCCWAAPASAECMQRIRQSSESRCDFGRLWALHGPGQLEHTRDSDRDCQLDTERRAPAFQITCSICSKIRVIVFMLSIRDASEFACTEFSDSNLNHRARPGGRPGGPALHPPGEKLGGPFPGSGRPTRTAP